MQLQKDAAQRLDLMGEELRNGPVSFSGRNLGDDGIAYIAEGFAFNDRFASPPEAWLCHLLASLHTAKELARGTCISICEQACKCSLLPSTLDSSSAAAQIPSSQQSVDAEASLCLRHAEITLSCSHQL